MKSGKDRCPGCDCRNVTGEIRATSARRSCCKKCSNPNAPCAYVAIFECENEWPLKTRSLSDQTGSHFGCLAGEGFYWPGFPYGTEGKWFRNKTLAGLPSDIDLSPLMISPFVFLGKKCIGDLNDDGCQYASYHAPYPGGGPNFSLHRGCNIKPSYWRPPAPDIGVTSPWIGTFPWKHGGGYIPFRFEAPPADIAELFGIFSTGADDMYGRRGQCMWPPYVTPEWVAANPGSGFWFREDYIFCENSLNCADIVYGPREGWSLDVDAGTLSFMAGATDLWNKIGRSAPTYAFVGTSWKCDKENPFRLTNFSEWPELKRNMCIVAAEWPWYWNPCRGDREAACKCCERGGIWNGRIELVINGCQQFTGPFTIPGTRHYSIDTVPYPLNTLPGLPVNAPCGFHLGGGTLHEPCEVVTPGTGSDAGSRWWDGIAFLYYCDGEQYQLKLWCHEVDGPDGNHVGWEEIAITQSHSCDCEFPHVAFTMTSLPCCCPRPPCTTGCCDADALPNDGVVSDGTNTLTLEKTDVSGRCNSYTITSALSEFCGITVISGNVDCSNDVWTLTLNGTTVPLTWDGDCEAILLEGTFGECAVTVTI